MCISLVFHDLASACLRCTTSSHSRLRRVVFLGIKLYHCARYFCCCLLSPSFFVYLKKLSSFSHCSSFGETICGLRVRCCCFSVLWYDGQLSAVARPHTAVSTCLPFFLLYYTESPSKTERSTKFSLKNPQRTVFDTRGHLKKCLL